MKLIKLRLVPMSQKFTTWIMICMIILNKYYCSGQKNDTHHTIPKIVST